MSSPKRKFVVLSSRKSHQKIIKGIIADYSKQTHGLQLISHLSMAVEKLLDESGPDAVFIHAPLYAQPQWQQPLEAISKKLFLPMVVFFDEPLAEPPHFPRKPLLVKLQLNDPKQQRQAMSRLFSLIDRQSSRRYTGWRVKRYEEFFNEAPVMNVITRNENDIPIIIDHNKKFAQTLGYDAKEILGKPLHHFFSETPLRHFEKTGYRSTLEGRTQPEEYELVTRDGRIIHTLMHAMPELDADRQVTGMRVIFVDITERKKMEEELRKLSSIIEQTADHVMVTDTSGRIQYVNPAFEQLTGYTAEEALGKHARILKSGKHSDDFYRNPWRTILAGKVFREVMINRKKNGELFYEEKTITPIKDEQGHILYFVSTGKDITDRIMLEERLHQMQKLEAIGRLAAGITHDFNHILALILGHAEDLLSQISPGNPLREQIQEIIKATQAGANLTRKLLAFSKTQALEPKTFNLRVNIEKIQNLLRRLIPQNIALRFESDANDIYVHLDPAQIDQLILNFVINARDALPQGGEIVISLASADFDRPQRIKNVQIPPGHYALIRISDNGIGMTEDLQKQIFEPFFSTKKKSQGTGLGLSTNYGIIHQSKGHVIVHSQPNRGTTFEVYLPRVKKLNNKQPSKVPGMNPLLNHFPTILVVEDSDIIQSVIKQSLQRRGYQCLLASSGKEAKQVLQHTDITIDLLISDIQLPDSNGLELARTFRKRLPGLKVILMSGYHHPEVDENGVIEEGMFFLQKPFSMEEFWQKVDALLGRVH